MRSGLRDANFVFVENGYWDYVGSPQWIRSGNPKKALARVEAELNREWLGG